MGFLIMLTAFLWLLIIIPICPQTFQSNSDVD